MSNTIRRIKRGDDTTDNSNIHLPSSGNTNKTRSLKLLEPKIKPQHRTATEQLEDVQEDDASTVHHKNSTLPDFSWKSILFHLVIFFFRFLKITCGFTYKHFFRVSMACVGLLILNEIHRIRTRVPLKKYANSMKNEVGTSIDPSKLEVMSGGPTIKLSSGSAVTMSDFHPKNPTIGTGGGNTLSSSFKDPFTGGGNALSSSFKDPFTGGGNTLSSSFKDPFTGGGNALSSSFKDPFLPTTSKFGSSSNTMTKFSSTSNKKNFNMDANVKDPFLTTSSGNSIASKPKSASDLYYNANKDLFDGAISKDYADNVDDLQIPIKKETDTKKEKGGSSSWWKIWNWFKSKPATTPATTEKKSNNIDSISSTTDSLSAPQLRGGTNLLYKDPNTDPYHKTTTTTSQTTILPKSLPSNTKTKKTAPTPTFTNEALVKALPRSMGNFADLSAPLDETDKVFFWKVHLSGATVAERIFGKCFHLTQTSEYIRYTPNKRRDWDELHKIKMDGEAYYNVDTTTMDGIGKAKKLGLIGSDVHVLFSPLLHEMGGYIFTPKHRGRMITLLRHPMERAIGMYFFLQTAAGKSDPLYKHDLEYMSIEEYAKSSSVENNWLTRFLAQKKGGRILPEDVKLAKEILRRKCLIGLMSDLHESIKRFQTYFGWSGEDEENCKQGIIRDGDTRHLHPMVPEESKAWEMLMVQNRYDMEVYEYALEVYKDQAKLFHS